MEDEFSVVNRRVCRLCLAPETECVPIFTTSAADKEPLSNKILTCVSIKVSNFYWFFCFCKMLEVCGIWVQRKKRTSEKKEKKRWSLKWPVWSHPIFLYTACFWNSKMRKWERVHHLGISQEARWREADWTNTYQNNFSFFFISFFIFLEECLLL